MTFSPEWRAFQHAKNRCENRRTTTSLTMGGRGIRFRFVNIDQFMQLLGPRPSAEHSLDRIDVNGNYELGNVRWATPVQHANNRRP